MSDTSSFISNIFKTSNNNSMGDLNKLNNNVFYEKNKGNISKTFFQKSKFDFEVYISLMLNKIGLDIIPDILSIDYDNTEFPCIIFDTSSLVSLRKIFETKHFHYIVNELLSFLKTIKDKNVLIGSLNIDTVYVNEKSMKFYVLDITNTIFKSIPSDLNIQSLYVSLYNNSVNYQIIQYFEQEVYGLSKDNFIDDLIDAYI